MRVPYRRRKSYELVPSVLQSVVTEARNKLSALARKSDPDALPHVLTELERIQAKLERNVPDNVRRQILSPWPSDVVINAVQRMTWRLIRPTKTAYFLTSDNPAYFFEGYGLGTPEAELTFPLSADLALVASHQGEQGTTIYLSERPAVIKEINRRVASGAEQFVFFRQHAHWVEKLATKKNPFLSRIVWR